MLSHFDFKLILIKMTKVNSELKALERAETRDEIEKYAKIVFKTVDTNGNGKIEKAECAEMIKNMSACNEHFGDAEIQSQVNSFMNAFDNNVDTFVSWEEFFSGCLKRKNLE